MTISIMLLATCFQFSGVHAMGPNLLTTSILGFDPLSTSPYVSTFPISQNSSGFIPFVISPASTKTVWLVTIKQGNIINNVVQSPKAQIVNYTLGIGAKPVATLAGVIPSDIVYDKHRNRIWFLENDSLAYYNQTSLTGNVTIEQTFPGGSPQFMTIDSTGRIWLTLLGTNQIAEYDPSTKQSPKLYNAPAPDSSLQGITNAKDGTIWFAETAAKRIGRLTPCQSTSCAITDFGPPSGVKITFPIQLAVDPTGTVWFTDHGSNQFGSFDPSTNEWNVFPIGYCSASFADCGVGLPNAISVDSNGKVWFSEHYAGRVARYDPSNGTLTEYSVPASSPPYVWWMSPGPGNLIWFVAFGLGEIGYVNASVPVPISISAVNSVELERGGSRMIPSFVQKPVDDSVYLNVSANSNDSPFGLSPLLYGTPEQDQIGPGGMVVSAIFRIAAAWNLGVGDRFLALTAYTNNIAVSTFVRVDVFQTGAPYFSAGLASSAVIGTVVLYWRYLPKTSKKSQNESVKN